MATNDVLLRFFADFGPLDKELARQQSKNGKYASRNAASANTNQFLAKLQSTDFSKLSPRDAGKLAGAVQSLNTFAQSMGALGDPAKLGAQNAARIKKQLERSIGPIRDLNPKEFAGGKASTLGATTRALRTGGGIGPDGKPLPVQNYNQAVKIAQERLAKAIGAQAGAAEGSAKKLRIAEDFDEQIRRLKAELVVAERQRVSATAQAAKQRKSYLLGADTVGTRTAGRQGFIDEFKSDLKGNVGKAAAQSAEVAAINTRVKTQTLINRQVQSELKLEAEAIVQRELYNRELNKAVAIQARQNGLHYHTGSGGQMGNFRGGRLGLGASDLFQGARSTIRYGLPAAALYGTVSGIGNIITQASELEIELGMLEDQWENMSVTAGEFAGMNFDDVKGSILGVAEASITTADEVASVMRQFSGAFQDEIKQGVFDLTGESEIALQFSKITKLPLQEITDSLTSVRRAFAEDDGSFDLTRIADVTTFLEKEFGVQSKEIATFVADIAPLAKELNFTYEQIAGLGAIAQRASGRSGTILGEQLGRILPSLGEKQGDLFSILAQSEKTSSIIGALSNAFAAGDIPRVLQGLATVYDDLNDKQTAAVGDLIGTKREASTLFAVLSDAPKLEQILDLDSGYFEDAVGSFDERWSRFTQTFTAKMEEVRIKLEKFGLALWEGGLGDALKLLFDGLGTLVDVLGLAVKAFGAINEALGGFPAKTVAVTAAIVAMTKAWRALRTMILSTQAAQAAGLLAPGMAGPVPIGAGRGAVGGVLTGIGANLGAGILGMGNWATKNRFGPTFGIGAGTVAGGGAAGIGASLLGGAVVAGAAILTEKAVSDFVDMRKEVDQASNDMRTATRDALKRGMSPQRLREIIDETRDKGTAASAGRFFSGQASEQEIGEEEITDFYADQYAQGFEDFFAANKDKMPEATQRRFESTLKKFKEDPSADRRNSLLETVRYYDESFVGVIDNLIRTRQEDLAETDANNDAYTKSLENLQDKVNDVEAGEADYAAGKITRSQLRNMYQQQLDALDRSIADAENLGEVSAELIAGRNAAQDKIDALNAALNPIGARKTLASLSGVSAAGLASFDVLQAQAELSMAGNDDERYAAATAIVQAQQAEFEAWVDEAATEAERLRRLQAGYDIDPEALDIIRSHAIQGDSDAESLALLTGLSIEQVGDEIVKLINGSVSDLLAAKRAKIITDGEVQKAAATAEAVLNGSIATPEGRQALQILLDGIDAGTQGRLDKFDSDVASLTDDYNTGNRGKANMDDENKKKKEKLDDLEQARLEYLLAQVETDPVEAAKVAQQQADLAYRQAEDEAGRLRAQADRIRADRQLEDAIFSIGQARLDLLIAIANSAGNETEAAQYALDQARAELAKLQAAAHPDEAAILQAQAAVKDAEANVRDTGLSESLEAWDVAMQLGQATEGQFAAYLQYMIAAGKTIGLNDDQINDLRIKLKNLKGDLGDDYKYNLPTDIALPTLYEVRRSGQTPGGAGNYQDNRVINIQFSANTTADAQMAAQAIIDELNRPSRFGSTAISMY